MACRVNLSATSFARAAAALDRTAQVKLCGERLRQVVARRGSGNLKGASWGASRIPQQREAQRNLGGG